MSVRRTVLVLPGLTDSLSGFDVLADQRDALLRMTTEGRVFRLRPDREAETPETAWLGLDPELTRVRQGPLTVAAFRLEPPSDSVHFHLSLSSVSESSVIQRVSEPVSEEEAVVLRPLIDKLAARRLTPVWGESVDHALVWEGGSIDLATTSIGQAEGGRIDAALPEGDGEQLLRRLIDDSVNLLSGLELNERRVDEGRPPLNLLWPWGHGFRPNLTNLTLERGESVHFESRSLRLEGLVRLAGYVHGRRAEFGRSLRPDWRQLLDTARAKPASVVVAEHVEAAARAERWDEGGAMLRELVEVFVTPLTADRPARIALMFPSKNQTGEGLALYFDSELKQDNKVPLDGRVVEDRTVPIVNSWEFVERLLRP